MQISSVGFHVTLIQSTSIRICHHDENITRRASHYTYSPDGVGRTHPYLLLPPSPNPSRRWIDLTIPIPQLELQPRRPPVIQILLLSVSYLLLERADEVLDSPSGMPDQFLFKTVPDRFHSPESIANQIRRLCRHDETTICPRHMVSAKHVQDADKETIKSLCKKLLSFCCGRVLRRRDVFISLTTLKAFHCWSNLTLETEMTDLSINDCFVRATFQQCGIDDATVRDDIRYIATEKTLFSIINRQFRQGWQGSRSLV